MSDATSTATQEIAPETVLDALDPGDQYDVIIRLGVRVLTPGSNALKNDPHLEPGEKRVLEEWLNGFWQAAEVLKEPVSSEIDAMISEVRSKMLRETESAAKSVCTILSEGKSAAARRQALIDLLDSHVKITQGYFEERNIWIQEIEAHDEKGIALWAKHCLGDNGKVTDEESRTTFLDMFSHFDAVPETFTSELMVGASFLEHPDMDTLRKEAGTVSASFKRNKALEGAFLRWRHDDFSSRQSNGTATDTMAG
jgi:hypothetical protein